MKSFIPFTCSCGHQMTMEASGTQGPNDQSCPACGALLWFVEPLGNFVGGRIFSRAWTEFKNEDFTLTIVLSAMGVECEMSRLFIKWNEIEIWNTRQPTQADRDALAEQWRKWNSIAVRLDKVSVLMVGQDFNSFLSHNSALLTPVVVKYPEAATCTDLKKFFIEEFFHKRNKIVHGGEIDFQQPDAEICLTLSGTLFRILSEMDTQRIKVMDAKHKKEQNKAQP